MKKIYICYSNDVLFIFSILELIDPIKKKEITKILDMDESKLDYNKGKYIYQAQCKEFI